MAKSVLDTPELLEIENKAQERVINEFNTTLLHMENFNNFFSSWEQEITKCFGKRDIDWYLEIKRKEKEKCSDHSAQ